MNEPVADFSSHRFLVADDKRFVRSIIHRMLSQCRAGSITHASNGAEAIRVLAESDEIFDCVLCDWNMEPVDGLELLRSIRTGSIHRTPRDLCVVLLTGHSDEHLVKSALAFDANGYVVKPVSLVKLADAIESAFARPVEIKPAAEYQSMELVDLPGGTLQPAVKKRIPPWAVWSGKSGGDRHNYINRLDEMRNDAAKIRKATGNSNLVLSKKQKMNISDIPEGKILAEDIYSEEGKLLLAIGTPLTRPLIAHLRALSEGSVVTAQLFVGDLEG